MNDFNGPILRYSKVGCLLVKGQVVLQAPGQFRFVPQTSDVLIQQAILLASKRGRQEFPDGEPLSASLRANGVAPF
jgi:hypothetical protein